MSAHIVQPRQILIGGGVSNQLVQVLHRMGWKRPMVVTDPFMMQCGYGDHILKLLKDENLASCVFSETVADPTSSSINRGLKVLKEHNPDCVVALGGGSAIDSAKAIAFLGVHGGKINTYKAPTINNVLGLPVVAIPTTAGTGSEVTQFTVITDDLTSEKMLCAGMAFCPVVAIVDYEFTLSKPQRLTADTGIDALTHAIEAYVSKKSNPFSDGFAQLAMVAISQNLRKVYNEPNNRVARDAIMLAATKAGLAFSNSSVCLVHGMSRPIGAFFQVPHGLSNAMLLPFVTRFSIQDAPERYAACARFMGIASSAETNSEANKKLIDELFQLNVDLNVPTLKRYGIGEVEYFSKISVMAKQALASGSPKNNPRVPTVAEIESLYSEVWV